MYLGNVFQPNRRAIDVGNDQRAELISRFGLIVGINEPAPLTVFQTAFGAVGIGARQGLPDLFQAETIFVHGVQIELDAYCGQGRTPQFHLTNAIHLRELLRHDGGRSIVHLTRCQGVGGKGQQQDR